MKDRPYEKWLAERREVAPPATLADQIMSQVAELERRRRDVWWLRVVQRIEQSRAARWTVYGAALAIGSVPFFFLVQAAQLGSL
jgi:hypothetical protein